MNSPLNATRQPSGFSFVELLLVIFIMALLSVVAVP